MKKNTKIIKRKNGIDLFRLIGAFFVMCVHTGYGYLNLEITENIRLISRWAVPFFFMASGYFLGFKINNNVLNFKSIQKNVSTLISILFISSLIYLPIQIGLGQLTIDYATFIVGTRLHLWFIGALIIGYLFIWYLFFIQKAKLLPYISSLLLIIGLLTDSYDLYFNLHLKYGISKLLLSIPFMHIGILIAKKNIFSANNIFFYVFLVLIGILLQYFEAELFLKFFNYSKFGHQFLIGTIVIVIPLFALSEKLNLKENLLSKLGREYALFIYLYHFLIYGILRRVLGLFSPDIYGYTRMFTPIIGFTLTLLFGILLKKYHRRLFNIMNGRFQ